MTSPAKAARTIRLGHISHDLGKPCKTCQANEARCAYLDGCCPTCSHNRAKEAFA